MKSGQRNSSKDASVDGSVREQALSILYQINQQGAFANLALDKGLQNSSLSIHERNLITEMVNGTVRMQKHLDWVLAFFLKGKLEKQNPWFLNILRLSLYQLLFMENIPPYACINEAVNLTRQRVNSSMARVVNAILRNILRQKDNLTYPPDHEPEYLAVYHSHPDWIVKYYLNEFGWDATVSILEYNNRRPSLDFRCNQLKTSPEQLVHCLHSEGVACHISSLIPWAISVQSLSKSISDLQSFKEGLFYVQNQASMLAAWLLNPQPGETVFDLCAGVGGKTTQMAELMNNQGKIIAFDIYPQKLDLLAKNASRMGISIICTEAGDATQIAYEGKRPDRIMLDAPCSGLGVLNRRADSRWQRRPEELKALLEIQQALLHKAAQLVKEGGYILYSTCSTLKQENQLQVEEFLEKHPDFRLEPMDDRLEFFPLRGEDRSQAQQGMLLLIPGRYNTDGMFYALLRRI
ncbi:MAG: 16S rRNA (cytosine(967)-C(5))-methyltransferase RsmB [Syntrophomonadaceae bacterium]|nr:16S rRNA (cytosine(967)-C(5))-methyltransferase RsmB [Syntrophomonadaceae bacterium]